MKEIKTWSDSHPTEVIVLYFGAMLNREEGLEELKNILEDIFGDELNDSWQNSSQWPTLGQAKQSNKRIFAFVRVQNSDEIAKLGDKIIAEKRIKIDAEKPDFGGKYVSVLSTFMSGDECSTLVKNIEKNCRDYEADFTKLALFVTHQGNSIFNCINTYARNCNAHVKTAIEKCQKSKDFVNFLQSDYPNHPGKGIKSNVEIAFEYNLKNTQEN